MSSMEPYVGIAVFELFKTKFSPKEKKSFFREDFYIVYSDTEEGARKKVEELAHENESSPEEAPGSPGSVILRHIIDVAPALYGYVDKDCDLYSRHFDSLEDYKKFEMKLGGTDPFASE